MNYQEFMATTRKIRTKIFKPIAKFLLKLGFTANYITFLSFVLGLISIYFLFQNHFLFIFFAAFHLLADGLDGVLARLTKVSNLGKYFDYFTDRTISLLILVKIYFYLQDYYVLLTISLFLLSHLIYTLSKFKYPIIFYRTGGLILFSFSPLFSFNPLLTFSYLGAGVFSLFTLLLQLKYFLRTKIYSP